MSNTQNLDNQYIAQTYARFPIELERGKGSEVFGSDSKRYIDMGSGIGVTAFGFCDSEWQKAVTEQLSKLQHTSNLYYTRPCTELAKLLCEKSGMKRVFFSNSGAEANECAIKAARKYAFEKKGAEYYTIVTLQNSFHGRTVTTLAATGQQHYHKDFLPLTDGFVHTPANDFEALKECALKNKAAAVMMEIVQGEGGVLALDKDFIEKTAEFAKQNDILLIIDEVQTGNGRSGKMYAYMNYDISPDIVSTAKGLGGGLPIGATLFNSKTENVLNKGDHGSTFGANPVSCAGALSIVSRIDDKLLCEVREKSKYIFDTLSGAEGVKSVSGLGLMIGIKPEKPAAEVVKTCMENGVLVLTAKDKVRLLPALNIDFELLKEAVEIIKKALK